MGLKFCGLLTVDGIFDMVMAGDSFSFGPAGDGVVSIDNRHNSIGYMHHMGLKPGI